MEKQLRLASVFTSGMVLQRDIRLPIWGNAEPNAKIAVNFAGQTMKTAAGEDGKWRVELAPLSANQVPGELVVNANGRVDERLELNDILVGEVWVCSGQSNMEWPIGLSKNAGTELENANYNKIRLLTIPKITAATPQENIAGLQWQICNRDTAMPFSAVGYYFGRELHKRLKVPIGLINSSWGGTAAEPWTTRETLLQNRDAAKQIELLDEFMRNPEEAMKEYRALVQPIQERIKDRRNVGFERGWAKEAIVENEWASMNLPAPWQMRGLNFSGVVWFRKEVEVPASWAGEDLALGIGATDKSDVTYFNNAKVGSLTEQERSDSWCTLRNYTIPKELVKPGKNVIAVRVHSGCYLGGMTGPADAMRLSRGADKGDFITLAGDWQYQVEENYGLVNLPPMPMGAENQHSPAVLFNAMISPLMPMAIRGVIWYQGESNVGRATQYQWLFPAMIQDWRKHWRQGDFPFLFVQLANYKGQLDFPDVSDWAELREAQTLTLRTPATGMAVTIDIGEAEDIHPTNKQDVGLRLALCAMAKVYGENLIYSGPTLNHCEKHAEQLVIHFDHVGGGLVCAGESLIGFAIAGADRKFVWADAVIDGDKVVLSAKGLSNPQYARYAWADNPACNLYNSAMLPAVPFRTDNI